MEKIKLSPLQQSALEHIQTQRQEINKVLQGLNEREKLVLELVFEGKIPANKKVGNLRLEDDQLIYELAKEEVPAAAPVEATPKGKRVKLKKE